MAIGGAIASGVVCGVFGGALSSVVTGCVTTIGAVATATSCYISQKCFDTPKAMDWGSFGKKSVTVVTASSALVGSAIGLFTGVLCFGIMYSTTVQN